MNKKQLILIYRNNQKTCKYISINENCKKQSLNISDKKSNKDQFNKKNYYKNILTINKIKRKNNKI